MCFLTKDIRLSRLGMACDIMGLDGCFLGIKCKLRLNVIQVPLQPSGKSPAKLGHPDQPLSVFISFHAFSH